MRMNPGLGKLALLASLFALFAVSMVGADLAEPAIATAPQSVVVDDGAGSCSTAPANNEILPTTPAWMNEASAVCQYTCPMNMVQFCPEIQGYTVTCNNGCCEYC